MTQKRSRKPIMSYTTQFRNSNEDDENHWYHPHSSSPPSSLSVNNSFTHHSSSATIGSWGFDVNRSTNGQTPLSFSPNNNNNHSHQHTNRRITKDYDERLVDISSSTQNLNSRTPTLTRHRNGNEFAAVDRLVLGPNRGIQSDHYPSDDSLQQQMTSNNRHKTQTEQELLAWQNRMLERDQHIDNQSPNLINRRHGFNSSQSSTRQIPTSVRPISVMSNLSENQQIESDHQESTIKSARVIKRYIELLYHLQTFYERITTQLFHGNNFSKTNQSSQSIFLNHCRKIAEQLQKFKPIWEEKLANLQVLLKDISSFQRSSMKSETTFLQRRSTLINLMQTLNIQKDLDHTHVSIRTDIDRVLHEDKLAVQLQDELSTLLQHQSLLNDFTSLLQWNRQIYSANEQNRVENILPLLREQTTTTDSYIAHVSQQLTELVANLRSLEKYILSYTNTIPSIDDEITSHRHTQSNRGRWRQYDENDIDSMRESRLQQHHRSGSTNDDLTKTRSASTSRHIDSEESGHHFDRDDLRISTKKSNIHLNSNNSNSNGSSTRFATVKSAKRDNKTQPSSILKPHPHSHASSGRKTDRDIDTEMFKPNRVHTPDRLIDFDTEDRILPTNERSAKIKKKEEVHKTSAKQNMQEMNDQDSSDGDTRSPFNPRRFGTNREKAVNLQSVLAEEAKEKSRQISAKHHLNKPYQQRSTYPNA